MVLILGLGLRKNAASSLHTARCASSIDVCAFDDSGSFEVEWSDVGDVGDLRILARVRSDVHIKQRCDDFAFSFCPK